MSEDDLRDIVHHATDETLPPAAFIHGGDYERARIQAEIADTVIGAIRALEHGADSFGGLVFRQHCPSLTTPCDPTADDRG